MRLVDLVSETARVSWPEAYAMEVYEFLNIATYAVEKSRRMSAEIEEFRRRRK